jgi:2-polyprenyl-3-methyl-5-hydroxy-6-metoxy-1,4-benzoquinol methylase
MGSEANAQAYYDRRWADEGKANLWAMRRAAAILSEFSLTGVQNPRILDFGCGTGWMTEILAQFGSAEGVDLSPAAARKFHPTIPFHDVNDVPKGPFDVVVSQEVIEHVEDQAAYLDTVHELLRQGGYLILTTPNASVSMRHPEFLVQPIENHLTARALRALLQRRFNVRKLYSFHYGFARWRPYRLQIRLGRLLNAGLHLVAVCNRY